MAHKYFPKTVQDWRLKHTYVVIVALLFISVVGLVSYKFIKQARRANDELIAEHVETLRGIFKKINDDCKILAFRRQQDHIDFLNVKAFEGSIIGPMSLKEPQNWKGPYLRDNLTMSGRDYQIVLAKTGYYILPGDGVRLSNGKIIGESIKIDQNTDIEAMMRDPKALLSSNKPLAARIEMFQNPFEALTKTDLLHEEIETTH